MKSIKFFLILSALMLVSAGIFAQNPTVKNGVATYHANKNIGRKFKVPDSWDKIVIKANVTVTGSFYFPTRTRPMEIMGESRKTSIIKGDGSRPTNDGINGRSYSAIRFDKSPNTYIHDLRSLNPMKFHIMGGFGNVKVERCDLIENRGAHSSDGIHGGSVTIDDCYIDTWDDALYLRDCKRVENCTIIHNTIRVDIHMVISAG
ncbi:MAG: glycoside hydrolase family 28 protein [Bacteroidales bacterium]|nr:glycoside hydrolase family 28 protein [Bacteroidales bacterium]